MIGIDSEIFCQNCNNQFNENNLPRMLTMCGHTYCENCISKMIKQQSESQETPNSISYFVECPDDHIKMSLKSNNVNIFPKNLALLKVLESKKSNSSFKDQIFNLSKIVKQQQVAEDLSSDELINAMNEGKDYQNSSELKSETMSQNIIKETPLEQFTKNEQQTKNQENQPQEYQICLLHQKPFQIICLNDQQKICSKCAIFGEHKGHDFKGIEQVQQETNACYMKILRLFESKQEIQKRMSNSETETALIDILIKKRDNLQKQVRDEFRKVREQITKQQKKVLKKLQEVFKSTQFKIKCLLKVDEKIIKNYNQFQSESFELIKILQGKQIELKVGLLYSKDKNSLKIIRQGQQIINDLKSQQNTLIIKVEQILSTLECRKNKKIIESMNDFVQIISESKKKIQPVQILEKPLRITPVTIVIPKISEKSINQSNYSILQKQQGSPLLQESLLDIQQDINKLDKSSQLKQLKQLKIQIFNPCNIKKYRPLALNQNVANKDFDNDKSISSNFCNLALSTVRKGLKIQVSNKKNQDKQLQQSFISNQRSSILHTKRQVSKFENDDKPNKKKLKSIKVPQKFQKILDGIYNNTLDIIDLTNAELGDMILLQICEFVKYSKARTIKFIRNKLTDSGVQKMLASLGNAQILNLSQNNLTENVLDIIILNRYGCLSGLKNLILSQNKIIERKHKVKIDQLRAMNLTVSV